MTRIYLYAVVEGAKEAVLGAPGLDGVSPLRIVGRNGLGCVVSDYDGEEFKDLPKPALLRSLLAHQQVVELAMEQHTVLPVKFGTLLNDCQEVADLLAQGRSALAGALAAMRDKIEMEVAATWDVSRVLQKVSQEEAVVRAREALPREPERQTLEQRLHLGQIVKECMDRRRDGHRERMVAFMRPLAIDAVLNPLVSDAMVMNVAFLLEKCRQQEFEARVVELDELFGGEITFRVIGPLPPYSFSTVEVTGLTPEQIEEAREVLQLADPISEAEVRKAYRRSAADVHRQLRPGDKLASDHFARLRQASELLLGYCRAHKGAERRRKHVGPARQGRRHLFLVDIRRSRSDEVEATRFGGGKV